MTHTIQLSDKEVMLLIGGLLCRVRCGMSTGEDHGALLSELKNMVGIEWQPVEYFCNDCEEGEQFVGTCRLSLPRVAAKPRYCPIFDGVMEYEWKEV